MVNKTGVNRNTNRQPHWNGKNPAQIPDAAPRSRTALDPVAYDNLIKQHGVRVKVYRSMFCPNVKSVDGGEHNIDCTLCNGSGYLDVDPIESVAYLANQNFQEEMTVEGYHDGNSVGATFLGGVELQYFTRVDLMDFTQPFYERVLRRADSTKGLVELLLHRLYRQHKHKYLLHSRMYQETVQNLLFLMVGYRVVFLML